MPPLRRETSEMSYWWVNSSTICVYDPTRAIRVIGFGSTLRLTTANKISEWFSTSSISTRTTICSTKLWLRLSSQLRDQSGSACPRSMFSTTNHRCIKTTTCWALRSFSTVKTTFISSLWRTPIATRDCSLTCRCLSKNFLCSAIHSSIAFRDVAWNSSRLTTSRNLKTSSPARIQFASLLSSLELIPWNRQPLMSFRDSSNSSPLRIIQSQSFSAKMLCSRSFRWWTLTESFLDQIASTASVMTWTVTGTTSRSTLIRLCRQQWTCSRSMTLRTVINLTSSSTFMPTQVSQAYSSLEMPTRTCKSKLWVEFPFDWNISSFQLSLRTASRLSQALR